MTAYLLAAVLVLAALLWLVTPTGTRGHHIGETTEPVEGQATRGTTTKASAGALRPVVLADPLSALPLNARLNVRRALPGSSPTSSVGPVADFGSALTRAPDGKTAA